MWLSKLGNSYPLQEIQQKDKQHTRQLDQLRKQVPENRICADCGSSGTVWASVNLGVFLCLKCGSHHRGLGTHVSLPKGCTGTYLWGPDEIAQMKAIGNANAKTLYGGDNERPSPNASDQDWRNYIRDKYEHRKFAPRQQRTATAGSYLAVEKEEESHPNRAQLQPQHHLSQLLPSRSKTTGQEEVKLVVTKPQLQHNTTGDLIHFDNNSNGDDNFSFFKKLDVKDPKQAVGVSTGALRTSNEGVNLNNIKSVQMSQQTDTDFFEAFGL